MAYKYGKVDGVFLGMIVGLLLSTPKISVWFSDFLNSVMPINFYIFGDFSLPIFGILIGAVIGFIIDKT